MGDQEESRVMGRSEIVFAGQFMNLTRPFRYEGRNVGVSIPYVEGKKKLIEEHFESEYSFLEKDTAPFSIVCKPLWIDRSDRVSRDSRVPYTTFLIYAVDVTGAYYYLRFFIYNSGLDENIHIINEFQKTYGCVKSGLSENENHKWAKFRVMFKFDPADSFEAMPHYNILFWKEASPPRSEKPIAKDYGARIDLGLRTNFSPLDSIVTPKEWIQFLTSRGVYNAGFADYCSVAAFPEIEEAVKKHNKKKGSTEFKPLYGVTFPCLQFHGSGSKTFHMKFYAKNQAGLKLLYQKITNAYKTQSGADQPTFSSVDVVELSRSKNVWIVMPTVRGELFHKMARGPQSESTKRFIYGLSKIIHAVEISPLELHGIDLNGQLTHNGQVLEKALDIETVLKTIKLTIAACKVAGVRILFSSVPRLLYESDNLSREALLFSNKMYNADSDQCFYWEKEHFHRIADIFTMSQLREAAVDTPQFFIENSEPVQIVFDKLHLPTIEAIEEKAETFLIKRVFKGLENNYGKDWRKTIPNHVRERLEHESSVVLKKYATVYVSSLLCIDKSKSLGHGVGSRGSVGSSAVAYFSGVSEVNPLPPHYRCPNCQYFNFDVGGGASIGWDLPPKDCPDCNTTMIGDGWDIEFSTFVGLKGDKTADIDLNFSGKVQGEVMNFVYEELFPGKAFRVGTILQKKESGQTKEMEALFGMNKAKNFCFAKTVEGASYSMGKHAGGVLIFPKGKDPEDFTPLSKPGKDDGSTDYSLATHFPYEKLHDGLLKMDLLGYDGIDFLDELQDETGIPHESIYPPGDHTILKLFLERKTLGVNEFTTFGAKNMLETIAPQGFNLKWKHLVSMSGLQHGTGVWAGNAEDLIKKNITTIDSLDGCRDEIVQTLGKAINDFSEAFTIVESVRKGKGVPVDKVDIVKDCKQLPNWYFNFLNKIEYMFPKAHAAAYLIVSAKQMWYKHKFPGNFYAVYLGIKNKFVNDRWFFIQDDQKEMVEEWELLEENIKKAKRGVLDRKKKLMTFLVFREAHARGYKLSPPRMNESRATRWIFSPEDNIIIAPYQAIPGIGEKKANAIFNERMENGPFGNIDDFFMRCSPAEKTMTDIRHYKWGEWTPTKFKRLKAKLEAIKKEKKKLLIEKRKKEGMKETINDGDFYCNP